MHAAARYGDGKVIIAGQPDVPALAVDSRRSRNSVRPSWRAQVGDQIPHPEGRVAVQDLRDGLPGAERAGRHLPGRSPGDHQLAGQFLIQPPQPDELAVADRALDCRVEGRRPRGPGNREPSESGGRYRRPSRAGPFSFLIWPAQLPGARMPRLARQN